MGVEEAVVMMEVVEAVVSVVEAVVWVVEAVVSMVEAVVSVVEAVVSMVEAVNSGLLSLGVPWMAPPDFGRAVNPISRRSGLCPPHYYWLPRILRPSYGPVNEICRPSLHSSLAFINLGDLPFNFLYQQSTSIMISISLYFSEE